MSRRRANRESMECSLTKAVVNVSNHGHAQMEALKEKQKTLKAVQAVLSEIDNENKTANQELQSKTRRILMLKDEVELLKEKTKAVYDRCVSVAQENTRKRARVREAKENHQAIVAKFDAYRQKMALHRDAVLREMRETEAHKELEKKKLMVQALMKKRDEQRKDLENPNGIAAQNAKQKIEALKMRISERKAAIAKLRKKLKIETENNNDLKKGIEIQNRRHEAIIKRLRCQISRAQATHRQMSMDIHRLRAKLDGLKNRRASLKKLNIKNN